MVLRFPEEVHGQGSVRVGAVAGETDPVDVKEDDAAVTPKGGEADDLEIGIDLGAVVHGLQGLAVESGPLVGRQPLVIHIPEDAAEGLTDERLQGHLLQPGQGRVPIAEDPVHRPALLVKHHLDVREGKGHRIEAGIPGPVFLQAFWDAVAGEAPDHAALGGVELLDDGGSFPGGEFQGFAVIQIDGVRNVMNGHGGHQAAPMNLDKALAQGLLQLGQAHAGLVDPIPGHMDRGVFAGHQHVQDGADIQNRLSSVGHDGNVSFFRHFGHLTIGN